VALEEKRRRGDRVIDLTLSNPTQAGFDYPEEIEEILGRAGGGMGYRPQAAGLPEARRAIQGYYADKGIGVETEQLLLTASTSEAYGFLFKLLADPGDELLVPRPSYPLFEFLAGLEGLETRSYPLRYGGAGWEVDVDRLAAAIGERSRAIVLVSPNNPTGSFVKRQEREDIEALSRECGLALIADEVFADYTLDAGQERGSFAAATDLLTFTLSGLSKVLGLPQLKLSWIVIQGPEKERHEALARLEVIADTYLSVGTPIQEGLPELLRLREGIQKQIGERIRGNLAFLKERIANLKNVRLLACEGGWYAVLKVEEDEERLALELLEEGLFVHPGFFFDFTREGFLVLSLLPEDFPEGVERLAKHLVK
jgi:alanine-synthesizing transaminase